MAVPCTALVSVGLANWRRDDSTGVLDNVLARRIRPREGNFLIQFRGICGGDKLENLRRLPMSVNDPAKLPLIRDYIGWQPFGGLTVTVRWIDDMRRQISSMMPNMATTQIRVPGREPSAGCQAPEPYHSAYLIWKYLYRHEPVVVMSGVGLEEAYTHPLVPTRDASTL